MPDVPPGGSDADRGTAPDAGRYRSLVVATAVTVTGAFTAFTCINPYLTDVTGVPEAAIGPILFLRGLTGLAGAVIAGFLVTRHAWRTMVVLIAGQAVAMAAQYEWGDVQVAAVVAAALAGLVLSALTTVLAARVLEVAPASTDLASAGVSTAFNVGITAGALAGSYLLADGAVHESALLAALITSVGLVVVLAEPRFAAAPRSRRVHAAD